MSVLFLKVYKLILLDTKKTISATIIIIIIITIVNLKQVTCIFI